MTTIAFDKESVSVDTRMSANGLIVSDNYNKIRYLENGEILISTGVVHDIDVLIKHYLNGAECYEDIEVAGLLIRNKIDVFKIYQYEGFIRTLKLENITTMGSGSDFALSAMDFGCSSKEAIKYAMTRDSHTGGKIKTIKLKDTK
jgi:ATP-dependent protease HslVU (ClpYQ) peptidase subunit